MLRGAPFTPEKTSSISSARRWLRAVQGAVEAGEDLAEAAVCAVEATRQVAPEMGLDPDEATTVLAAGALEAAEASGEQIVVAVRHVLHTESS